MKSQDIEHLKNVLQRADDITDADRSKLLDLLNTFSGYGLVWVDKQEENENKILNGQMPVLKENLSRYIKARKETPSVLEPKNVLQTEILFEDSTDLGNLKDLPNLESDKPAPHHLLIEGDNLPALTALTYTHEGAIDVIYIDPPYNTGNKDFKYNDRFVDKEDPYRHSKWLSFMHKRLLIAKRLLKNTGVIFISIDDNEHSNLKLLCDEVFDEKNFVANIIWQKKFSPQNDAKFFSDNHDFILCYRKENWKVNLIPRSQEQIDRYKNLDNDPRGLWTSTDLTVKTYSAAYDYPLESPSGKIFYPPSSRCWFTSKERMQALVDDNRVWFGENGNKVPRIKKFLSEVKKGVTPLTIWLHEEVGHNQSAKQEMKAVLHDTNVVFDTPKPTKLIERILQLSTKEDTTDTPSVILDFFAGSGTTQHAVMQLNAEDGGNRQCILVTNNENNIAEEVCYERNKRVINGYTKPNGTEVKGLTNNHLHYYQLDWFDEMAAPLAPLNPPKGGTFAFEHSSIRLARLMREMLMIKENCFEDIEAAILRGYHPDLVFTDDNHPDLDVLESADKYMVIIYTDDAIVDGVHIIEQLPNTEKPVVVYPFEYQGAPDAAPFEHITDRRIVLKALPNSYKETYDHIIQDLKKRRRRFVVSDEDVDESGFVPFVIQ